MAFTLDTWKEALKERFKNWQGVAKESAYGSIAATTLLPVVAASSGADAFSALMTLGGIVSGVGGNLIASELNKWRNASSKPEEIAKQITERAKKDKAFRDEIDTILEKLKSFSLAEKNLSESDKSWFSETLQKELENLGNIERFSANISGDGNIFSKSITNSFIVSGNENTVIINNDDKIEDTSLPYNAYLRYLFNATRKLVLSGINPENINDAKTALNLESIYTTLNVYDTEIQEDLELYSASGNKALYSQSDSALNQLNQSKYLVLLGDPGSGKSTFINFVALCLTGEALKDQNANLKSLRVPTPTEKDETHRMQPWDHNIILPVRVLLRDFAARGLPPTGTAATGNHLWQFIQKELREYALADFLPLLEKELRDKGGLLLLDGLDEVPEAKTRRTQIMQAVEGFKTIFPNCRILVTSRTYAYLQQNWRLQDFAEAVLAPFSDVQIEQFIDGWYNHIGQIRGWHKNDVIGNSVVLKQAIKNSASLQELARRPLLLTLMASLHTWRDGSLPEKRAELYKDSVDLLLDWWERPKTVRDKDGKIIVLQPSLAEWLNVDRDKVRRLINRLAFESHSRQADPIDTADVLEKDLVFGLSKLKKSNEQYIQPEHLKEYLSQRAGLLIPRGVEVYTFPHRTFQEYLTACHLTDDEFPDKITNLLREDPNRWREVALLAAAKSTWGSQSIIWHFIDTLCPDDIQEHSHETDCWLALLAAEALAENWKGESIPLRQEKKLSRLKNNLIVLLGRNDIPAIDRTIAGSTLAQIGDPRSEIMNVTGMQFCCVPPGPFLRGKDLHQDNSLRYIYWMGRYPVTNAQYQQFVDAGGYEEKSYWLEAESLQVWESGKVKDSLCEQWHDQAEDYNFPFNLPNHPVVGISWYEMLAFTRWLTNFFRENKWISKDFEIRLPSAKEWEKAARGGTEVVEIPLIISAESLRRDITRKPIIIKNLHPQRIYPWGNSSHPNLMNHLESKINSSSTPGCFRGGVSPYGCEDMSGNIWEWTRTRWSDKIDYENNGLDGSINFNRIPRGGSFSANQKYTRCDYYHLLKPALRGNNVGFRVLLSPSKIM